MCANPSADPPRRQPPSIRLFPLAWILAVLLAACSPPTPAIFTLTPAPVHSATPTAAPTLASTRLAPSNLTPAPTAPRPPTPGPLTAPAVLARYPLEPFALGECLAVEAAGSAGAGRVWVGRFDGRIEERSAADGRLLAVFPVVTADPIRALAFDGAHLWAVTFDPAEAATWITVLNPGGQIVTYFDASDDLPEHFGQAPGQLWTQNAVYDTLTLAPTRLPMTTDATVFAADDQGRMWAAGTSACDSCASAVDLFSLSAPAAPEPGPEASQDVRALAFAGRIMWALTAQIRLDGYDLTAANWREPAAQVDLSAQVEVPTGLLFDGAALWLLAGPGAGGGMLYQHDPLTGRRVAALPIGESEGENARVPLDLAFDGRDLWVLTALDLVRVGLPWTQ